MRRLVLVMLMTLAALATSGVALADHGDARAACADFNLSPQDFGYFNDVVTANVVTQAPSCPSVTYTLVVIVDPGDANSQVVTKTVAGTGVVPFTISTDPFTDVDETEVSTICAYVLVSRGGRDGTRNVLDRYPNDPNCVAVAEGGTGGGAGHAG